VEQPAGGRRELQFRREELPRPGGVGLLRAGRTWAFTPVTGWRAITARSSQTFPRTKPRWVPSYRPRHPTAPNNSSHGTPVSIDAPASFTSASQYTTGSGRAGGVGGAAGGAPGGGRVAGSGRGAAAA